MRRAQLIGPHRRGERHVRQARTRADVPGRDFGRKKPAYPLTSTDTFSGGKAVAYEEGIGVSPDVQTTADAALSTAYRLRLDHVTAGDEPTGTEAVPHGTAWTLSRRCRQRITPCVSSPLANQLAR